MPSMTNMRSQVAMNITTIMMALRPAQRRISMELLEHFSEPSRATFSLDSSFGAICQIGGPLCGVITSRRWVKIQRPRAWCSCSIVARPGSIRCFLKSDDRAVVPCAGAPGSLSSVATLRTVAPVDSATLLEAQGLHRRRLRSSNSRFTATDL
jgi:hypothetical protein